MNYLRDLIHRLRLGQSERSIAKDLHLSRQTVSKYRELAKAAGLSGWSVAVDDRTARRVAGADLGLNRLTGIVGILRTATEAGLLTIQEAGLLLEGMVAAGYWSPVPSLVEPE